MQSKCSPQSKRAVTSQLRVQTHMSEVPAQHRGTADTGHQLLSHQGARAETSPQIVQPCREIKDPHAYSARFRNRGLKERAFARANALRNDWVSTDQRHTDLDTENHQTSAPRTTDEFWVGPFLASSGGGQGQPRPHGHFALRRLHGVCLLWWCQWSTGPPPPNRGRPSATTSSLRVSAAWSSARSRSRTLTFVVTLPPASRQIRAVTVSNANPLLPKIPALAQAARKSSGWPHRQKRADKGRGRWRHEGGRCERAAVRSS